MKATIRMLYITFIAVISMQVYFLINTMEKMKAGLIMKSQRRASLLRPAKVACLRKLLHLRAMNS